MIWFCFFVAVSELAEVLHKIQRRLRTIGRNKLTDVPPIVLALVVGFAIIVIATLFPEIKQTIIDIAQAFRM